MSALPKPLQTTHCSDESAHLEVCNYVHAVLMAAPGRNEAQKYAWTLGHLEFLAAEWLTELRCEKSCKSR